MKPIFIYSDKFLNAISWFIRVGGISIFPIVVMREKYKEPKTPDRFKRSVNVHRHETIHFRQQLEMLVIPFYVWYAIEFVIKFSIYRNYDLAYRSISFEREAYSNEAKEDYIKNRKMYNWIKLL